MAVRYNGILLTTPTATPFTADTTIWGFDVIVTAATAAATIFGANGVAMAVLAVGVPFYMGGIQPVSGEPLRLSDYSATSVGNVHVAYAVRAT